ncbi:MAG: aldehyde dehydrogenase family protein [Congregibacter sp.]
MTTIQATNPRTGRVDFTAPGTSPEQLRELAGELRLSQRAWAASLDNRLAVLNIWAEALQRHAQSLAEALTEDTGRRMLSHFEVMGMIQRIHYWAKRAPQLCGESPGQKSVTANNVGYLHQRIPYPLVGVISPWNFPLTLSLVDAIPALFAGSAVLIKPSEVTPRFAGALQRSIDEAEDLRSVLRVVVGDGSSGAALVDNVDMICFTGSVKTGRKVAVRAAENLIPACLELGGKDPAFVLEDADLDAAAEAILRSAAGSCGQACMSVERIYVHQSVFDKFREALVTRCEKQRFNTPDIHAGTMYPFIDQRQAAKVAAQLQDALDKGAQLHCGGAPESIDGGLWMPPTVLTQINHDMQLMREETFGPVLPLMPFTTDAEAIALANDSDYGLSGCVFGGENHALTVARAVNAGAVGINDASMTALIFDIEKQSFAYSGLGPSRMGDAGLLRFFRTKALMIQRDPPAPMAFLDEAGLPT